MTISRLVARSAAVCGLALAGGCDLVSPGDCTLVGCTNGLMIELENQPNSAYRVEVQASGSPTVFVFECPDPSQCADWVLFPDYTPSLATVTITSARGTVKHLINPTYVESRPNGPKCEPLCRRARVEVRGPE